eukprot:6664848-Pyramimonas_sp.AAC.1
MAATAEVDTPQWVDAEERHVKGERAQREWKPTSPKPQPPSPNPDHWKCGTSRETKGKWQARQEV